MFKETLTELKIKFQKVI